MNGRPRINEGFLVGHHEFYENERRRDGTAKIVRVRHLRPKKLLRRGKDKRRSSDE